MSSVLFGDRPTQWDVESIALSEVLSEAHGHEKIFVKIDIEGGEYELLRRCGALFNRSDLVLYLSVHPHFLMAAFGAGRGLFGAVLRRVRFFVAHWRLLRSLRFARLTTAEGHPISRLRSLIRAALNGAFPTEVVAEKRR